MRPPVKINLLQNPNFDLGSSAGWTLETGWAITPNFTSGYSATFTGPGTSAVVNLTKIMCTPGGNVFAWCWATGYTGAVGNGAIRITFFDSNDQQIGINHNGPWVPTNGVYVQDKVLVTAPDNVSYALVDFAVYNATAGSKFNCLLFTCNYLPGAVSVVPINYKQPLSYYLNLFTSQYRMSSRLNQWQAALLQPIDDLTNCLETMNVSYDIDNAFGAQLDVLGQIIGVNRTVPFQPTGGVSPILDDETYRTLLYATQAIDTWDGKTVSLYPIWQFLFPGTTIIITDYQNMTAAINVSGTLTSIEQDLIANGMIVPRPETVQYTNSSTTGTLFGFDRNDANVAGFDTGHFA